MRGVNSRSRRISKIKRKLVKNNKEIMILPKRFRFKVFLINIFSIRVDPRLFIIIT